MLIPSSYYYIEPLNILVCALPHTVISCPSSNCFYGPPYTVFTPPHTVILCPSTHCCIVPIYMLFFCALHILLYCAHLHTVILCPSTSCYFLPILILLFCDPPHTVILCPSSYCYFMPLRILLFCAPPYDFILCPSTYCYFVPFLILLFCVPPYTVISSLLILVICSMALVYCSMTRRSLKEYLTCKHLEQSVRSRSLVSVVTTCQQNRNIFLGQLCCLKLTMLG